METEPQHLHPFGMVQWNITWVAQQTELGAYDAEVAFVVYF